MRLAPSAMAFALIVGLMGMVSQAEAGCERYPRVEEEFAEADFVLIGLVTSARMDWSTAEPREFNGVEYTVRPLKVFKGEPPADVLLYSENSSGRFPMMVTGWYVLFIGAPYEVGFGDETRRERAVSNCGHSFALRTVPMALESSPTELTFEQAMALAPAQE